MSGESPFAPQPRGISLAALFLLVAIAAVLVGIMGVAQRSFSMWNEDWGPRLTVTILSMNFLGILGGVRGLFSFDRAVGVTLGIVCGAVVGLIAATIVFTDPEDFRELIVVAVGGSLLIVALAAGIRWQASRHLP